MPFLASYPEAEKFFFWGGEWEHEIYYAMISHLINIFKTTSYLLYKLYCPYLHKVP